MIILAISTSSPRGTVAVARGELVLARVAYEGGTSHAERLFVAIDEALALAGVGKDQLDALACDIGPGSFTGVRVGVATCQGIAVGLGIRVVGVGSLEAMAHAARSLAGGVPVLAVLDAKKDEVFAAAHDAGGEAVWGPRHLPRVDRDELSAIAESLGATVVGEVAPTLGLVASLRGAATDLPDAVAIARLGALRLAGAPAGFGDASCLEPDYVRPPDAKPLAQPTMPTQTAEGRLGWDGVHAQGPSGPLRAPAAVPGAREREGE